MNAFTWSRWDLLRAALAACGTLLVPYPALARPRGGYPVLRLGLVLPPEGERTPEVESALRGVTLGVEEAARTAALLGQEVELRTTGAGEVERLLSPRDLLDRLGGGSTCAPPGEATP